jgi:tetratricopeptide (TPR) repeat protein
MELVFTVVLALGVPPASVETLPNATTRLFVRTNPPNAVASLNGTPVGNSDGLFRVPPGDYQLKVELDGYASKSRQIRIPEGRITRVEIRLEELGKGAAVRPVTEGRAAPVAANQDDHKSLVRDRSQAVAGAEAASELVAQGDFADSTRRAMLTVLRQHPDQIRWSGRDGDLLFGIAVKPMTEGEVRQRVVPAMLGLVQMLAVHEVLKAKSLLDRYAATGLTDATTLRQAVELAAGELQVTGRARGLVHQAAVRNDFAVGYIVATATDLAAYLLQPAELDRVRLAYRDVMHRQARGLMEREAWSDALLLWQHLHQRKLVSQQLYLDAGYCFRQLEQPEDAVRVLREALKAFATTGTAQFFEQAGDLALEIEDEAAQTLAAEAYQKAIDALRETISGVP